MTPGRRRSKKIPIRIIRPGSIRTLKDWKSTPHFSSDNRFSSHLEIKMRIVTYSLSSTGPAQTTDFHDQLFNSVKSLRAYNRVVSIHVFLYGEHPHVFIADLERQGVIVHQMGSYEDAIRRIRPRAFRTLVRYP